MPGFCEVDMVAHGGTSTAGSFIQTLKMVRVSIRARRAMDGHAKPDLRKIMHPMLAQVYMTALADQLAGERQLQPMTDETL